ncbi:MAG: hypothetical protein ACK46X_17865, partial [Candidatus Sericytochromatia bacterium]
VGVLSQPGQGSTFWFSLAVEATAEAQPTPATPPRPHSVRERLAELQGGWTLEHDGHVLAHLSGWRVPDQFWHEFDAAIVTECPERRAAMLTDAFWHETPLTLRSALTGRTVRMGPEEGPLFAMEQGRRLGRDGALSLRGL